MALPTISVDDREIVLLNGYKFVAQNVVQDKTEKISLVIVDEGDLVRSVKNNNDAVAYGYVDGQWIVAA